MPGFAAFFINLKFKSQFNSTDYARHKPSPCMIIAYYYRCRSLRSYKYCDIHPVICSFYHLPFIFEFFNDCF